MLKKAFLAVPLGAVAYQLAPELNEYRLQAAAELVEPLRSRWWLHVHGARERGLLKGVRGRVLELEPRCGESFPALQAGVSSWTGLSTNPWLEPELRRRAAEVGFPAGVLELQHLRPATELQVRRRDVHLPLDDFLEPLVPRDDHPERFWADGVTFGGAYDARFGRFHPATLSTLPQTLPAPPQDPNAARGAWRQRAGTANELLLQALRRLPTASYDSLVARRVLARCSSQQELERLVTEMHRVLRPGGRLFMLDVTAREDSRIMGGLQRLANMLRIPNLRHVDRWTLRPLEAVLREQPQLLFERPYVEFWPSGRNFSAAGDPREGIRLVEFEPQTPLRSLVGADGEHQSPQAEQGEPAGRLRGGVAGLKPLIAAVVSKAQPVLSLQITESPDAPPSASDILRQWRSKGRV